MVAASLSSFTNTVKKEGLAQKDREHVSEGKQSLQPFSFRVVHEFFNVKSFFMERPYDEKSVQLLIYDRIYINDPHKCNR